jgi:hypothetical protein
MPHAGAGYHADPGTHLPASRVLLLRVYIMYATQAAASWWTWMLHVTMVLMGCYLIANLALAVIFISFAKHYSSAKTDDAVPEAATGMCRNLA